MKAIQITEFTPEVGLEYTATAYPGNGAYLNRNGNVYFVLNGMMFSLTGGAQLVKEVSTAENTVSSDLFLRALAITQNPSLSVDLLK